MSSWHIAEALASQRRLAAVLRDLSDEELNQVIRLEQLGSRRPTLLNRLSREAQRRAKLNVTKEF